MDLNSTSPSALKCVYVSGGLSSLESALKKLSYSSGSTSFADRSQIAFESFRSSQSHTVFFTVFVLGASSSSSSSSSSMPSSSSSSSSSSTCASSSSAVASSSSSSTGTSSSTSFEDQM